MLYHSISYYVIRRTASWRRRSTWPAARRRPSTSVSPSWSTYNYINKLSNTYFINQ